MNLAGGDCVDDIEKLEADEGFCRILAESEKHGTDAEGETGAEEALAQRAEPDTAVGLGDIPVSCRAFIMRSRRRLREKGKAFIPAANEHLKALAGSTVN